jgi:hypothetical protein
MYETEPCYGGHVHTFISYFMFETKGRISIKFDIVDLQ